MRFRLIAGAAAAGSLLLSSPVWAGQAGSVYTLVDGTVVEGGGTTVETTVGGISIIETDNSVETRAIEESLDSSAVTLSLEVYEDGYHGYSPADNVAEFAGDVTNLIADINTTSGITTVQQAAGQANVSVSANTLIDAGDVVAQYSAFAPSGGAMAAFVLSPAFTLSNSKQAAQALAVAALGDAVANGAFASDLTAIKFDSSDSFEMSPEGNLASFAGVVSNQIDAISATAGITTVQQAAGQSNVQSAFTTVLYGANAGEVLLSPVFPAP